MTERDVVALWSQAERRALFEETAAQRGVTSVVAEKDYWVCWTLDAVFSCTLEHAIVFKGGTSLSKAFGVIERFSEDIDLCVSRDVLGLPADVDPYAAASSNKRKEQVTRVRAACVEWITTALGPALEQLMRERLRRADATLVPDADDPGSRLFHYPAALTPETYGANAYIEPAIRLELGARGDGWPAEDRDIRSLSAELFAAQVPDIPTRVRVLSAERTFWEKATLTHAEFHRPHDRPTPEHLSRHYHDLVMLVRKGIADRAIAQPSLREDVLRNTATFFPQPWASYDTARPGSFHIVPAPPRIDELRRDYGRMRDMFFSQPPDFATLIDELATLETRLNAAH